MDLQKQLLRAGLGLTDADFDHHASDLYVRAHPGVMGWLKNNYKWAKNVTLFWDDEGNKWLEVPFAYEPFWEHAENAVTEWAKALNESVDKN